MTKKDIFNQMKDTTKKSKKEKYFKGNIELFSNSVRLYNEYDKWTADEFKKNQEEVLTKLCLNYNI